MHEKMPEITAVSGIFYGMRKPPYILRFILFFYYIYNVCQKCRTGSVGFSFGSVSSGISDTARISPL